MYPPKPIIVCIHISYFNYRIKTIKVYISFLKSYKRQSNASINANSGHSMKAYVLGKRLQVFLKDVLPLHIHYFTDFEGKERIGIISSQVDEYLNNLIVISEMDDSPYLNEACSVGSDECASSRGMYGTTAHFENELGMNEDKRDMESIEGSKSNDNLDMIIDKDNDTICCGSNASTSYSVDEKLDWVDCDYVNTTDDCGFILCSQRTDRDKKEKYREKLNTQRVHVDEDKEKEGKNRERQDSHGIHEFEFKTLISHWKAQERKWAVQPLP